jgi:hypothetical protein
MLLQRDRQREWNTSNSITTLENSWGLQLCVVASFDLPFNASIAYFQVAMLACVDMNGSMVLLCNVSLALSTPSQWCTFDLVQATHICMVVVRIQILFYCVESMT